MSLPRSDFHNLTGKIKSHTNNIQVDWSVVATKCGYKDAKTASTRYGQIMKKLTGVSAGKAMSSTVSTTSDTSSKAAPKQNGAGRGIKKEKQATLKDGVINGKVTKPTKKAVKPIKEDKGVSKAKAMWDRMAEEAALEGEDFGEFEYGRGNGGRPEIDEFVDADEA